MTITSLTFVNMRKLAFSSKYSNYHLTDNVLLPKQFNIISGPNGSGKSTILDIIRSPCDATMLKTLSRENMRADSQGRINIVLSNGREMIAIFNSQGYGKTHTGVCVKLPGSTWHYQKTLDITRGDDELFEFYICLRKLDLQVAYRCTHGVDGFSMEDVIPHINRDASFLIGTAASGLKENTFLYTRPSALTSSDYIQKNCFSISAYDQNSLMVWFNDDQVQTNQVRLDHLPAGWKSFSGLLTWLTNQLDGTVCVIEEPETHLHPSLQRVLIKRIKEIAAKKNLQLFISTHSTIFLDYEIWDENTVNIYVADGYGINEFSQSANYLSMMGIRPGDVFQANGIIWVEGVSDRIYIKHWLKLYCQHHNLNVPVENVHYAFIPYGGAMMKHFSTDDAETINVLMINKNAVFLADRDNDYAVEDSLNPVLLNGNCYKETIRQTLPTWITEGYTLENYLPEPFFSKYFEKNIGITKIKNGGSKVKAAQRFAQFQHQFMDSFHLNSNLPELMDWLYENIISWNES
ncbi:AAA family ATPase [Xenorhabdus bovienii]|uniref:ATP-dependent nuclease n=1 Tax=Xenorhabdus bovienii TaxID=40576 RepID=UPI00237C96CE|nr:AAA family ATPase [Xenorhabdus bovienii]MDE1488348.1 AAA family ATPase [Xenorhabdus bovienii]MDE9479256.1 AAA family ATPase [Xenorhabdus bovienii]MDE9532306.1 AAA family ATPase [Xenorhabdus bovienii]